MSTFKEYARRAKQRMKSGFWEQAKRELETEKQVAATQGLNPRKVGEEQHRKLHQQIYDYNGFCAEQDFYNRVVEILESAETVSNPIMRLADRKYMETLTPADKQVYISKLANRYRQAVEKYNNLHN